jgi:hypothetical protein
MTTTTETLEFNTIVEAAFYVPEELLANANDPHVDFTIYEDLLEKFGSL